MAKLFANSGDSDQMLHFAASDLGLHCLPITLLGVPDYNGLKCLSQLQQMAFWNIFLLFIKKKKYHVLVSY